MLHGTFAAAWMLVITVVDFVRGAVREDNVAVLEEAFPKRAQPRQKRLSSQPVLALNLTYGKIKEDIMHGGSLFIRLAFGRKMGTPFRNLFRFSV